MTAAVRWTQHVSPETAAVLRADDMAKVPSGAYVKALAETATNVFVAEVQLAQETNPTAIAHGKESLGAARSLFLAVFGKGVAWQDLVLHEVKTGTPIDQTLRNRARAAAEAAFHALRHMPKAN